VYRLRLEVAGAIGTGTSDADVLVASEEGANQLIGHDGNDQLFATGDDTLHGGAGNDTYYLDPDVIDNLTEYLEIDTTPSSFHGPYGPGADVVVELAGEGTDVIHVSYSYELPDHVENLVLRYRFATHYGRNGTGNDLDNSITGNVADNTLDGRGGNDILSGSGGNDSYVGFGATSGWDTVSDTSGSDRIEFGSGSGVTATDLQFARVGDNLTITIDASNGISISGWYLGSDRQIESLVVHDGDLQFVYSASQIQAAADGVNSGPVVMQPPPDQMLTAGVPFSWQVPLDTFADIESQDSLVYGVASEGGAALPSWLTFDPETRTLFGTPPAGLSGATVLELSATDASSASASVTFSVNLPIVGTVGDDALTGAAASDVIDGLQGNDSLSGLGGSDVLYGREGDDVLDGGADADTLSGGLGNDIYVVDTAADTVTELAEEGADLVQSSVTYTLGENVENLTLTGSSSINGTGNELSNLLTGNTGGNTLVGGEGDDTLHPGTSGTDVLQGGLGSDIYVVDRTSGIAVQENTDEGTDLVLASVTHTLTSNVENLTLTGTGAMNGTGNSLDNVLIGNGGSNTLSGSSGNDTLDPGSAGTDSLLGGTGDDTYILNRSTGVTIMEGSGAGTDLVLASVTHTLASNVENLTLAGSSAINGTGNTLSNVLTGNSGNNTLNGGAGADTLIGGLGDDTYVVDTASDVVTELAGEGTDRVQSSVTLTLGENVENLTLTGSSAISGTGNDLNNALTGNTGSNTLTGGAGNDTLNPGSSGTDVLQGGLGDDTYVVGRTSGITVTEQGAEGTDLVQASVTYTLGNNVENLTLTGSGSRNGTGNALDNVLTGNSGSNTLAGSAGNDTLDPGSAGTDSLQGGAGDDVYILNRTSGVTISESASSGTDQVHASVTYTLSSNVEILFQTGSSAINGTGNTLDNLLRGNTGNNTLAGAAGLDILEGRDGNDTLSDSGGNTFFNGGAGTDTLTGGSSRDLFIGGTGNDTITTGTGADLIVFNKGDGADTVAASTTQDNVLSLGGGTEYADLIFVKSGNNLILQLGGGDQITFTDYYVGTSNRSIDQLQIVIEGTDDYLPGGGDATRDNKVETFDFDGLVAAFDAARVADPGLTSWALTNALTAQYLAGSDTAAIGGDLAYQYHRFGTLDGISFNPAIALLGNAGFVTSAQALQGSGSLQDGTPRLS
jgi:Ca2+-binding RTX toxin-like protein